MRDLIPILSTFLIILTIGCITDNLSGYGLTSTTTSIKISTTLTTTTTTTSLTTIITTTTTEPTINLGTTTTTTTTILTTTTIQLPTTTTSTASTTTIKIKTTTTTFTTTTSKKTTPTTTTTTTLKISKDSGIVISAVQFDAPGDDRKKENLNGEWVEISNSGSSDIDLTGWTLNDNENHVYNFPSNFKIKSGNSVKIHTGTETDTESDLYWNSGRPIWNNDGDTATLKDANGRIIDSFSK